MLYFRLDRSMSRKDAKTVLKYMQEIIDGYGYVTLADFYDLTGIKKPNYTDNKKRWHSLKGAGVSLIRKSGNYIVKLPNFDETWMMLN